MTLFSITYGLFEIQADEFDRLWTVENASWELSVGKHAGAAVNEAKNERDQQSKTRQGKQGDEEFWNGRLQLGLGGLVPCDLRFVIDGSKQRLCLGCGNNSAHHGENRAGALEVKRSARKRGRLQSTKAVTGELRRWVSDEDNAGFAGGAAVFAQHELRRLAEVDQRCWKGKSQAFQRDRSDDVPRTAGDQRLLR